MHEAVIVAATRTAVGKAPNGSLKTVRPDEMAAAVIADCVTRLLPGALRVMAPRPSSVSG